MMAKRTSNFRMRNEKPVLLMIKLLTRTKITRSPRAERYPSNAARRCWLATMTDCWIKWWSGDEMRWCPRHSLVPGGTVADLFMKKASNVCACFALVHLWLFSEFLEYLDFDIFLEFWLLLMFCFWKYMCLSLSVYVCIYPPAPQAPSVWEQVLFLLALSCFSFSLLVLGGVWAGKRGLVRAGPRNSLKSGLLDLSRSV